MFDKATNRIPAMALTALLALSVWIPRAHAQSADIDALREATAGFYDIQAAQEAGYTVLVKHPVNGRSCLRDPDLGGMGTHYLNPDLADASVSVTEPEVLIYDRRADGSLEFVGVEYIVPYSIVGENEPPPQLFGRDFMQNDTFQLWALHAWIGRDNPAGFFAPWNHAVSCVEEDLAELKAAVAPLTAFEAAQSAGYTVLVKHPVNAHACLRDRTLGAMGKHYLNTDLFDAKAELTHPAALIFEPQADGSLQFVGVEYLVPFSLVGPDQPPPALFGREFSRNFTFKVWALHAWIGRENPSGTFAAWNPDTFCEPAALAALAEATDPYKNFAAAQAAGYTVLVKHPVNGRECLRLEGVGGMGIHFLDASLADGQVAVTEPEVLIYDRLPNGSFDFVGVEYLIPFSIVGPEQDAPVLFGRRFTRNFTFGLWTLHAWVAKDNPDGTFAMWNPLVSCAEAKLGYPEGQPVFKINYGVTGSWWNPDTPRQGFSFEVAPVVPGVEGKVLVIYWFTFEPSGGKQMWFQGNGPIRGNKATLPVVQVTGGAFDDATPPAKATGTGSVEITFEDCAHASLRYKLDLDNDGSVDQSGTIPLQRLSPDVVCRDMAPHLRKP